MRPQRRRSRRRLRRRAARSGAPEWPRRARLRAALKAPPPASTNQLPGLLAPGAVSPWMRPRRSIWAPPSTRMFLPVIFLPSARSDLRVLSPRTNRRHDDRMSRLALLKRKENMRWNIEIIQMHGVSVAKREQKVYIASIGGFIASSGPNNLKVEQMAQNSLRLVEDKSVDKSKALEAALSQIETVVRQGLDHEARRERQCRRDRNHSDRLARPRHRARRSAACRRGASSRSTVRKARARPRWRCRRSPKRRRRAASAPSSMPNTRSIRSMPASSASTWKTC